MVYQIEQVEGFRSMNQSHTVLSPVFNTSPLSGSHRLIDERDTKSRTRFETSDCKPLALEKKFSLSMNDRPLRPAQVIESKLTRLLRNSSLPVNFLLKKRGAANSMSLRVFLSGFTQVSLGIDKRLWMVQANLQEG